MDNNIKEPTWARYQNLFPTLIEPRSARMRHHNLANTTLPMGYNHVDVRNKVLMNSRRKYSRCALFMAFKFY